MKVWHILGGITLSMTLAACAQKGDYGVSPQTGAPVTSSSTQRPVIALPAVTGTVNIRQRIALPPNAVLTVTVSDASLAGSQSKVIVQRVTRLEGKQAPFRFELPYQPSDVQPNARILLSAAISIDNRVVMVTENVQPVINNGVKNADLVLVPVASVPLPTPNQDATTSGLENQPAQAQPAATSQPGW
ncbi:YbaY family lipoprotein [Samsonia erythrinae]|uniref:Putative lipoprotein n=1 Tax=Samsonia erythrinae TaxID=160434 RepID=A0A4R3VTQ6_9GAMM|nr:YbaY family lipoprotein [Samsonia erythrinae]TCV08756.1 putative lipoprotein [Samsonia erythrinae]